MSGSSSRAAAAISISRCQPPDSVPNGLSRISGSTPISSTSTSMRHQSSPWPTLASDSCRTSRTGRSARPAGTSCGTLPTRSPRERITLPPLSSSSPVRHFSRVDLPAPFSPTSAVRASSSRNDTPRKTAARAVVEGGLLHAEHGLTRRHC